MLAPNYYTPQYKVMTPSSLCSSSERCYDYDVNSHCDSEGICKCNSGYQYLKDNITCIRCPEYGYSCYDCCAFTNYPLICKNNKCVCVDSNRCYGTQSSVIETASQIALTAALIMGIAALAMVIYRLCTKPKYETRARQRAERRMRDSIDIRSSLSSMQIRILARLRDRPPSYQNEQPQSILSTIQNVENPPSYNCGGDIESHLPPPYTEIVLNPSGYINRSFENTEPSINSVNANIENIVNANKNLPKNDNNENIDSNNNNNNNK